MYFVINKLKVTCNYSFIKAKISDFDGVSFWLFHRYAFET